MYQRYFNKGEWKCEKSPHGAHHWVEWNHIKAPGLFYCRWCMDTKRFPASYMMANKAGIELDENQRMVNITLKEVNKNG